ncbi:hypothetical protein TrispH2_000235 [Trichoplax sp. H2]|nr:hypothetical protein TrispH2_000235 [Trichoplax sp. H2]|eukprot:RDD47512.1 hypothetical protein TrispH2_000235 [Trichoplax sp. H2]
MADNENEEVPPGCVPKTLACILRYFTTVTRILGIIFFLVMWGIAVKVVTMKSQVPFGVGLIIITSFVTFLEVTWIINKCCCFREDSCPTKFWNGIMWIQNWRRSIIYLPLSVVCFIHPKAVPIAIASGVLLIILAILYLIRGCIDEEADPQRPYFTKSRKKKKQFKYGKLESQEKSNTDSEKAEENLPASKISGDKHGNDESTAEDTEGKDTGEVYGSNY